MDCERKVVFQQMGMSDSMSVNRKGMSSDMEILMLNVLSSNNLTMDFGQGLRNMRGNKNEITRHMEVRSYVI